MVIVSLKKIKEVCMKQTIVGQIHMTESEIADWGYGYCIPEKEEPSEND